MRDILAELQAKGVRAETIITIAKALEAQEALAARRASGRNRAKRFRSKINEAVTLRDVTSTKSTEEKRDVTLPFPPLNNPPQTQKPKRASVSRRTQMPADWHPVIAMEDSAEFDRFTNYCKANGKLYADWDAAWSNWRTSPYRKGKQNGHGRGRPEGEDVIEQGRRLADEWRRRERAAGIR